MGHILFVSVRSTAISICSLSGSRPLLFPHLRKRQSCADCDYIEDGVRWVGRQAQLVNPFPYSNPNVRRIEVGTLLRQLLASLLGSLICFMREAVGRSHGEVACVGQRHISMQHERSVASRAAPASSSGSIAILGLVDLKRAAFEVLAVQRLQRPGCIRIRHFDEAETARPPRVAIGDQSDLFNDPVRGE